MTPIKHCHKYNPRVKVKVKEKKNQQIQHKTKFRCGGVKSKTGGQDKVKLGDKTTCGV